jgi:hypothetical protein
MIWAAVQFSPERGSASRSTFQCSRCIVQLKWLYVWRSCCGSQTRAPSQNCRGGADAEPAAVDFSKFTANHAHHAKKDSAKRALPLWRSQANHHDQGMVANGCGVASEPTQRHGLRRQSESGDGAFGRTNDGTINPPSACESGVALRLPPQSKTCLEERWPS